MKKPTTLGAWLKAERIRRDLSRTDLAFKSGLGHYTIGRLERDDANPTLETLQSVLRPLGLTLADVPPGLLRRVSRST